MSQRKLLSVLKKGANRIGELMLRVGGIILAVVVGVVVLFASVIFQYEIAAAVLSKGLHAPTVLELTVSGMRAIGRLIASNISGFAGYYLACFGVFASCCEIAASSKGMRQENLFPRTARRPLNR